MAEIHVLLVIGQEPQATRRWEGLMVSLHDDILLRHPLMETNWRVAALFAEILRKVLVLLPGLPARQQHNLGRWRSSTRVTYCFSGGKVFPNLSTFAQHSSCWFPSSPDLDIPSIPGIPSLVPVRRLKSLLLPSLRSACPLHTHTSQQFIKRVLQVSTARSFQCFPPIS